MTPLYETDRHREARELGERLGAKTGEVLGKMSAALIKEARAEAYEQGRQDALVLDEQAIERAAKVLGEAVQADGRSVPLPILRNGVRAVVAALRNEQREDG